MWLAAWAQQTSPVATMGSPGSHQPLQMEKELGSGTFSAQVNAGGSFVQSHPEHSRGHGRKHYDQSNGATSHLEVGATSTEKRTKMRSGNDGSGVEKEDWRNENEKEEGWQEDWNSVRTGKKRAGDSDCLWHSWVAWSACSQTCGIGNRLRFRGRSGPLGNGAECMGMNKETVNCNTAPCPVDCLLNTWESWGTCSVECGGPGKGGTHLRKRSVKVAVASGGKACDENLEEKAMCMHRIQDSCPTPCQWSPWADYGRCSLTCGTFGGVQVRQRTIETQSLNGGTQCVGDPYQTKVCNKKGCAIDCWWHQWQDWNDCSTSCGAGSRVRIRDMKHKAKFNGICPGSGLMKEPCSDALCPVDCTWTGWGQWGDCSAECGGGERTKMRSRNKAQHSGTDCVGEAMWSEVCNMDECKPGR